MKSLARSKYQASEKGSTTIKRCEGRYRRKIKRVTVVITEPDLYLYQALLTYAYDRDLSISGTMVLALKEYLLRQQPSIYFD